MHEDLEPWVRRVGIVALVLLGLLFIGVVGNQIMRAMGRVSTTYRTAEQQSDMN